MTTEKRITKLQNIQKYIKEYDDEITKKENKKYYYKELFEFIDGIEEDWVLELPKLKKYKGDKNIEFEDIEFDLDKVNSKNIRSSFSKIKKLLKIYSSKNINYDNKRAVSSI